MHEIPFLHKLDLPVGVFDPEDVVRLGRENLLNIWLSITGKLSIEIMPCLRVLYAPASILGEMHPMVAYFARIDCVHHDGDICGRIMPGAGG